jgi:methionine synthase II (cobalamin-independent)
MATEYHAEDVGSLLRPPWLLEARDRQAQARTQAPLEDQDGLCRRIDQAARFVPPENLAISPQCGFASGSLGNLITIDDERRKLDLVVSTARKVWG